VAAGVSSYAFDGARLLLFDPLAVPDELLELAGDREPVVVLTAPWHERDTQSLVERLDTTVFAPPPDTAQHLIDKFGVTAEQAGDGSPDLRWLREGGGNARWYAAGDRLPIGIEAFEGREHNDLVLWVDRAGAVISGDTHADFGRGLGIADWLRAAVTREAVAGPAAAPPRTAGEVVLPAHGAPTDRAALERAIS
jgi:hypothetical protein